MKEITRIIGFQGIENLGIISPQEGVIPCERVSYAPLLRGAQPTPEGYLNFKSIFKGLNVINLRTHSDEANVKAAGLINYWFPLDVFHEVPVDMIDKITGLMYSLMDGTLLHCRQGQDRTGVVTACYRMRYQGWTMAEAKLEMHLYGSSELWFILDKTVKDYALAKHYPLGG